MEKVKLQEIQSLVLQSLLEEFKLAEIPAEISAQSENGIADILVTDHTDVGIHGEEVMGEYYFAPLAEEDSLIQYFIVTQTLTEDLPAEHLEALQLALTKINFTLPKGAFVIDKNDHVLTYRYVSVYRDNEDPERMREMIRYHIVTSLRFVGDWIDVLTGLMEGTLSKEKFMETFMNDNK